MYTRDDNVVMVYYPDTTTVVEFPDGTRITSVKKNIDMDINSSAIAGNAAILHDCLIHCRILELWLHLVQGLRAFV
jgi:hypothetical protein